MKEFNKVTVVLMCVCLAIMALGFISCDDDEKKAEEVIVDPGLPSEPVPPGPPGPPELPPAVKLSVSSVTPADGAQDVGVTYITITVKFSEEIDQTSVSDIYFVVKGQTGNLVAGVFGCSAEAKKQAEPVAPVPPDPAAVCYKIKELGFSSTYTVTLKPGLKAKSGNTLTADYTWSFKTAAKPPDTPPVTSDTTYTTLVATSGADVYAAGATDSKLGDRTYGGQDVFVAKYGNDGTKKWIKQFGSAGNDVPTGISVDGSGNVYLSIITDGCMLPGSPAGCNKGKNDIVVTRLDNAGNTSWVKQTGTPMDDFATSLSRDNLGVDVAGMTEGVPPGTKLPNSSTLEFGDKHGSASDYFMLRYALAGSQIGGGIQEGWDGSAENILTDIVLNPEYIFMTGFYSRNSVMRGFFKRYRNGICQAGQCGTSFELVSPDANNIVFSGLAVKTINDIFITGAAAGRIINGQQALGGSDAFLLNLKMDNNIAWQTSLSNTFQFGTGRDDTGLGVIYMTAFGQAVYVLGHTDGSFAPGASQAGNDLFLVKYGFSNDVINPDDVKKIQFGGGQFTGDFIGSGNKFALDSQGATLNDWAIYVVAPPKKNLTSESIRLSDFVFKFSAADLSQL